MSRTLADMVAELQEDVPAVDDVPSAAQYERAVQDAVREFSRRCGNVKNSTLTIVAGTATYTLPDDFMNLVEIDNPYSPEHNLLITTTGIIPFGELNPLEEEISIQDRVMTIFPTPGYSMARYYEYRAAWVLDVNGSYALTEEEAQIAMLKARSLAFEKISNVTAGAGFQYSVGNMSINKSGVTGNYMARVAVLKAEFIEACDRYVGMVIR